MKRTKLMLYLDPGTGTLILQMLIAFFVAVAAAVKIYWFKVKTIWQSIFSRK